VGDQSVAQGAHEVSDIFFHYWKGRPHPALTKHERWNDAAQRGVQTLHGKGGRAVFVYHLDDVNKAVAWAKQQMPPETKYRRAGEPRGSLQPIWVSPWGKGKESRLISASS